LLGTQRGKDLHSVIAANDPTGGLLVILFFLIVAGISVAVFLWEKKRRDALIALARERGLRFYKNDPFDLPSTYGATQLCNKGHSKRASNVIAGRVGDGEVRYFDYKYTVGSGKNSHTYNRSACAFHAPYCFTRLFVRPENLLDKAAGMLGFEDIDLDYAEFNSKYYVSCEDKKFAYDVLHQRAMEFFVSRPGITMEMTWNFILMNYDGRLSPDEIGRLISDAEAFCDMLPNYLKQDRRISSAADQAAPHIGSTAAERGKASFLDGIVPSRRRPQE